MADVRLDQVVDCATIVWDGGVEKLRVDHAIKLRGVTVSSTPPTAGQVLTAVTDTTAEWRDNIGSVAGSGTVGTVAVWSASNTLAAGVPASSIIVEGDSRLTNARTPTSHKASHQVGGSDALDLTGLSGLLATAQTPASHATSHKHGGADEVGTATPGANQIPKAGSNNKLDIGWFSLGTTANDLVVGNDSRLSNARTPTTHATSHQNGGSDQISVAGLTGLLATAQTPTAHGSTHELGGSDQLDVTGLLGVLEEPQTPTAHAAWHQNGGADEISVAGLSGELADAQVAYKLRGDGWEVAVSGGAPTTDQVLRATSATSATWQTIASGGDTVGAASSTNNEVVAFSGTGGKTLKNTSILYTNLIVEGDARLTNARTPTAHASSHQHAGADEIATATAANNAIPKANGSAKLDIAWIPTGTSSTTVAIGNDSRLSDARTPTSHAASHQSGGGDQISIAGLSGRAAGSQTADQIATTGTAVSISTTAPSANQVLRASSATAAAWVTLSYGDASSAVSSSTNGNVATMSGTGGKTFTDSGTALSSLVLTGDSRLSDARTPTAHSTSHKHGGADEVATATAGANLIPKSGAGGTLAIGWIPTGSSSSTVCIGNDSRLSDNRTANAIATSGTPVSLSTTAPSAGQILQASSATAAAWVNNTALAPSGTAADGSLPVATGASTALWVPDSPRYLGWKTPWLHRSPLPQVTSTSITIAQRTYWVYIGQLARTLPSTCFVNMYLATAGAGTQTAEVYVASSPSAPGAAQTLTVLARATTVDTLTSTTARVKRNSSAMDLSGIGAGTHLWLGFRADMASTQPTLQFISHDLGRGYCLFGSSASALSVSGTNAGDLGTDQLSAQFPELWLTGS